MKRQINEFYELLANLFGVFDTDWENDFEDDGYSDYRGRADIGEPLFISDIKPAARPAVEVVRPNRPISRRA